MSNLVTTPAFRRHPQVLHIGFSKCASTYLRAVFRSQPKVHLVFKSGFFTPFLAKDMTFLQYQSLFRDEHDIVNVESDEHLTLPGIHPELGVRSTTLEQVEAVADAIKAHLPDVRILMVIRNQAALMTSRYSEYLITGGSLAFEEFAEYMMGGKDGRNLHYQNHYSRIIDILESRFPRQNILVLLQENMRRNPDRTRSAIARLLALDNLQEARKGLKSERRSLSLAGMCILRTVNRFVVARSSVGSQPPETRVPLSFYHLVVKAVRGFDFYFLAHFSRGPEALLTETRRRNILDHFREDNLRLGDRLDVNLAGLGYLPDPGTAR
jgi:hypothetical protein